MKANANAKINLFLNVVSKREDGYHNLNMVTHPLELSDEISIDFSDHDTLEGMESKDNIIWKTINVIRNLFDIKQSLRVKITKNIPIGAGLGGGSADAAATLKILNNLFDLGLSDDKLAKIGVSIGADVPMCIYNKPAIIAGVGEQIEFIPPIRSYVLLVVPNVEVSTSRVFGKTKQLKMKYKSPAKLIEAMRDNDQTAIEKNLLNDFTHITTQLYEECKRITILLRYNGVKFHMTGTGSVYYALYKDIDERDTIANSIMQMGIKIITTRLIV